MSKRVKEETQTRLRRQPNQCFLADFVNFRQTMLEDENKSNMLNLLSGEKLIGPPETASIFDSMCSKVTRDQFNNIYEPLEELAREQSLTPADVIQLIKKYWPANSFTESIDLAAISEEFNWLVQKHHCNQSVFDRKRTSFTRLPRPYTPHLRFHQKMAKREQNLESERSLRGRIPSGSADPRPIPGSPQIHTRPIAALQKIHSKQWKMSMNQTISSALGFRWSPSSSPSPSRFSAVSPAVNSTANYRANVFDQKYTSSVGYKFMASKLKRLQSEIMKTTDDHLQKIGFDSLVERIGIDCLNLKSEETHEFKFTRRYSEPPSIFLFSNIFSFEYGLKVEFRKLRPKIIKWDKERLVVRAPSIPKSMLAKGDGFESGMVCYLAIGLGM